MSFVLDAAEDITRALDSIIADVSPGATRKPMYGGIVFQADPDQSNSMVCGHFVYKAHVGLEFSNGNLLDDPLDLLEGQGKFRRHLKLKSAEDIETKNVRSFLDAAFKLPRP